jgi:SEC-C motif-containing protein
MRSRYSAFAVGDSAYLLATWHPSTRPSALELDPELEWRRLEIRAASAGGEGDREGTVDFVASFWHAATQEHGQQREDSAFRRKNGQWFYVGPA